MWAPNSGMEESSGFAWTTLFCSNLIIVRDHRQYHFGSSCGELDGQTRCFLESQQFHVRSGIRQNADGAVLETRNLAYAATEAARFWNYLNSFIFALTARTAGFTIQTRSSISVCSLFG